MDWVAGFTWTGWQPSSGLGGNLPLDWVATFLWTGWQTSVEYAHDIACTDARLFAAFVCAWTPPATFDTLRDIARTRLRALGKQSPRASMPWSGRVQAGRFEQRGLDPGDLGPHQLTEKRQALAAQEQRQRVLVVRVGWVRLPLRAMPNAQSSIRQRLAQNRPDQGDVALDGVGGIAVRIRRHGHLPVPFRCASHNLHGRPAGGHTTWHHRSVQKAASHKGC
jgi:hypothetical protein